MSDNEEEFIDFKASPKRGGKSLPKNFTKPAYIQKRIVSSHRLDDKSTHPGLSATNDPFGLEDVGPTYSLNKKGRWKMVEEMRSDMTSMQDEQIGLKVSAVEKVETASTSHGDTTAYHNVDDDGNEVHKEPKGATAQERTLTEKPKAKKEKGKVKRKPKRKGDLLSNAMKQKGKKPPLLVIDNEAPGSDDEEDTGPADQQLHVRYHITTKPPDQAIYKKTLKDNKDFRKSDGGWGKSRNRDSSNLIKIYNEEEEQSEDSLSEEEELEETKESQELIVSLLDCIQVTQPPKFRTNKDETKDNKDSTTFPKPWLRQLSYQQQQPSTSELELADTKVEVKWAIEPETIQIPNWCLEHDLLKSMYGANYYECACLARRFCIDISEMVKYKALIVFEVAATALADTVFEAGDDGNFEIPTNVRVWVNANLSNEETLKWDVENGDLIEIGKVIEMAVDKLASVISTETCDPNEQIKVKNPNIVQHPFMDAFPSTATPKLECLSSSHVTDAAMEESQMSRKLQRQISAIGRYQWYLETGDNFCGVCYDWPINERGMCLAECQHWFCNDCWAQHCHQQLNDALVPIKCPDVKCDRIVDYDILTSILVVSRCQLYANLLSERHLLQNDNWVWCPGERCGRAIRITGNNELGILVCDCGQIWCANCNEAPHWPAACQHATKYGEHLDRVIKMKQQEDATTRAELKRRRTAFKPPDQGDLLVMVKKCPKCKSIMERAYGCNHMMCRCGHAFCWSCLKTWTSSDHYQCNYFSTEGVHNVKFVRRPGDVKREMDAKEPPRDKFSIALTHSQAISRGDKLSGSKGLKNHPNSTSIIELFTQVHTVLESAYVWMCWWRPTQSNERTSKAAVRWTCDRLQFVIRQLEETCINGGEASVDRLEEFVDQTRSLLRSVTGQILALRSGTDD